MNMQTNSFYVKSSLSPCGKWLTTGSSLEGRAFIFDVSNAGNSVQFEGATAGVELKGHVGEVGAVDWARDTLATCADDGTVRTWRPDIDVHNRCIRDPQEEKWNWCWANGL
jgi:denticleless